MIVALNLLVRTVRKPVEMHRNGLCSSHKADQVTVFSSVRVIVISCTTKSTFWTSLLTTGICLKLLFQAILTVQMESPRYHGLSQAKRV